MTWQDVLEAQSFLDDDDLDIAETLIALSTADQSGLDWSRYRAHFAALPSGLPEEADAAALARRMAGDLGYRGDRDTYDDMRNADITQVIDRRKGLPVALGLLYIHAGRERGWSITGLSFPGHFLLNLQAEAAEAVMDPFNEGQVLDASRLKVLLGGMLGPDARLGPEHMQPVPVRQVIIRLQNNIKVRALQARQLDRARAILHRMTLFAPGESAVWLEWAGIEGKTGNMRRAVELLEEGGDHAPDETSLLAMEEARRRLRKLFH